MCLPRKYLSAKAIVFISLAIAAVFFFSCSSGNSGHGATLAADSPAVAHTPAYDHSLTAGKVTDSVICRKQNNQSYALYLPTRYSSDKQFPCICFFDSHGIGSMPVSAYKQLAEKYGFVLVGSNASKNGMPWEAANDVAKTLMDDICTRINMDPKRIYTSGCSGGSRVAVTIAILDGGVAGVIGCAAGFPKVQYELQRKFDYFGLVGDHDFNLTEMEQWDETLAQNGFQHQLLTSGRMHGWASARDFETAMLWIQVCAMKKHLQSQNDTLIADLKNDYGKRIAAARSAGEWIKMYELLDGVAKVLDGLTDISSFSKQFAELTAGADLKKELAIHTQLQQAELSEQNELVKQFTVQDEKWWAKKIAGLKQNRKTKQESQMNMRLLNYLGLIAYTNSNRAVMTGDLVNAATYLKVFRMADPENADCSYLTAVYYMKKGNSQQAMAALNEAVSLGYSDLSQIITDPAFNTLHDDHGFKNVVDNIKKYAKNNRIEN